LGLTGPLAARVDAEVKEVVLKTVDEAAAAGLTHSWACAMWEVSDDRVHRWRAQRRDLGSLEDDAPGGNPVHGLTPAEIDAVLDLTETWGEVDLNARPRPS